MIRQEIAARSLSSTYTAKVLRFSFDIVEIVRGAKLELRKKHLTGD